MFKALNQFFAFFESMFRALTNLAQAAENTTEWAKDETAFFNEKSGLERDNKLVQLHADNLKQLSDLGISDQVKELRANRNKKAA